MSWLASFRIGTKTYMNLFDTHNPFTIQRTVKGDYVIGIFPIKIISHEALRKK